MTTHHLKGCPSMHGHECTCQEEEKHYKKLATISLLLASAEIVSGFLSGSVALISDGVHVLMDGSENVLNIFVSKFSRKHGDEAKIRKVGAKISAIMLLFAGLVILKEGYERLLEPQKIEGYMVPVALAGLLVNIYQQKLHSHALDEHKNITHMWQNMHLISDIGASVAVVIGGAVMYMFGYYIIDGVLSLAIGGLIVFYTVMKFFGKDMHSHHHKGDCQHHHH